MKKMIMAVLLTVGFAGAANAACCTTVCSCSPCCTTCCDCGCDVCCCN